MLQRTAASEFKRSETQDMLGVGLFTAWFLLGAKTYMGLNDEKLTESTYARRYIGKYKKLYAEKHGAHGDAHAAH